MQSLRLIPTIGCFALTATGFAAVLAQEGRPTASIIVPDEPTATVRFAAEELARYTEIISGAALPIIEESEDSEGTVIHVGPTQAARARLPEEPEGIAIHVDDGRVIICGGSDRATLFGVFRFLEEALGCRWLAPNEEHVPRMATIDVGAMDLATAPVFNLRTSNARREDLRAWVVKAGMNGFFTSEDVERSGGGYYFPKAASSCHAYYKIIPSDIHFEQHPEWFPLLEGRREAGKLHGRQLCVTAPGLADEFARRVIEIFDEDPDLQVMSISPNDGYGWCECEACRALDEKLCGARTTKQGLGRERPFRGDRVFWFANEVAQRVAKVHPDKLLLVLSYVNYAEPPDTIKPAPNVVPWLCHYAPADYSRPIADPTSEPNAQFNQLLIRWAESAPHLLFYSYVSKSMWWRLPRPVMHSFAADIKHLHSLGIRRYYCQSTLSDWALDGPLYYVIAKLLWDPSADPDAIAADWMQHMFGAAAQPMSEFYAAVEDSIRASGQSFSDNPPRHVPGLFDIADLERAIENLDAAKTAADTDETKARVMRVAEVFQYGYHMVRCLDAAHHFGAAPTRVLLREVVEQGEKAVAICPVREAVRFLSTIRMNDEMGVIAQGFGDAVELGGRRCWNSDETGLGDNRAGWATLAVETPDTGRPFRVEIDVWGASALSSIVINTGGQGKSYAEGGVWTSVVPEQRLSGEENWETLVFIIPPELLAPGKKVQKIGFGGADSQIWIAEVRAETVEE